MSGNTRFEDPGSHRDTVTYVTYDERSVSRDEIRRALRRANIRTWFLNPFVLAALAIALAALTVLVIWLIHPQGTLPPGHSGGTRTHVIANAAAQAAPFHGFGLSIVLIIAVPILILTSIMWYVGRM